MGSKTLRCPETTIKNAVQEFHLRFQQPAFFVCGINCVPILILSLFTLALSFTLTHSPSTVRHGGRIYRGKSMDQPVTLSANLVNESRMDSGWISGYLSRVQNVREKSRKWTSETRLGICWWIKQWRKVGWPLDFPLDPMHFLTMSSSRSVFIGADYITAASQNRYGTISFLFIRKPILFRKWHKQKLIYITLNRLVWVIQATFCDAPVAKSIVM